MVVCIGAQQTRLLGEGGALPHLALVRVGAQQTHLLGEGGALPHLALVRVGAQQTQKHGGDVEWRCNVA